MDAILAKLIEFTPSLLYMIVGGVTVWFVGRFYMKHIKSVNDRTAHADCCNHAGRLEIAEKQAEKTTKQVESIMDSLRTIENLISASNPQAPSVFSKSRSPLQLNDAGRELFEKSGAADVLELNRVAWVAQLEQMELKTALDVEEQSRLFLISILSDEVFTPVKNYVYNNPIASGVKITMLDIAYVVGLELRNAYLVVHPELIPER